MRKYRKRAVRFFRLLGKRIRDISAGRYNEILCLSLAISFITYFGYNVIGSFVLAYGKTILSNPKSIFLAGSIFVIGTVIWVLGGFTTRNKFVLNPISNSIEPIVRLYEELLTLWAAYLGVVGAFWSISGGLLLTALALPAPSSTGSGPISEIAQVTLTPVTEPFLHIAIIFLILPPIIFSIVCMFARNRLFISTLFLLSKVEYKAAEREICQDARASTIATSNQISREIYTEIISAITNRKRRLLYLSRQLQKRRTKICQSVLAAESEKITIE